MLRKGSVMNRLIISDFNGRKGWWRQGKNVDVAGWLCVLCTEGLRHEWPVAEREVKEVGMRRNRQWDQDPMDEKPTRNDSVVGRPSARRPQIQPWSAGLQNCPSATSRPRHSSHPRRPLPSPNAPNFMASRSRSVNSDKYSDPLHGNFDAQFLITLPVFNFPIIYFCMCSIPSSITF